MTFKIFHKAEKCIRHSASQLHSATNAMAPAELGLHHFGLLFEDLPQPLAVVLLWAALLGLGGPEGLRSASNLNHSVIQ